MGAIKIYRNGQWEYISTAGKSAYQSALDGDYPFDEDTFNKSLAMLRIDGDGTKFLSDTGTYLQIVQEETDPLFTAWKNQINVGLGQGTEVELNTSADYFRYNIAIGYDNKIVSSVGLELHNNIVIGNNNNLENGQRMIVIGENHQTASPSTIGDWGIVIGYGNVKINAGSVAIGYDAQALGNNNVAIGQGSVADSTGSSDTTRLVSFGSDTIKRRIINIADGVNDNDAVTFGQVQQELAAYLPLSGGTMTGAITLSGNSNAILPAANNTGGVGTSVRYFAYGYIWSLYTNSILPNVTTATIGAATTPFNVIYTNNVRITSGLYINNVDKASIVSKLTDSGTGDLYLADDGTYKALNLDEYLTSTEADGLYVGLTGAQTIAGAKTFENVILTTPTPYAQSTSVIRPTTNGYGVIGAVTYRYNAVYAQKGDFTGLFIGNVDKTAEITALDISGSGNKFLSDDGTYKTIELPTTDASLIQIPLSDADPAIEKVFNFTLGNLSINGIVEIVSTGLIVSIEGTATNPVVVYVNDTEVSDESILYQNNVYNVSTDGEVLFSAGYSLSTGKKLQIEIMANGIKHTMTIEYKWQNSIGNDAVLVSNKQENFIIIEE